MSISARRVAFCSSPAELTSASTRPSSRASASTCPRSATSSATARAAPPSAAIFSAARRAPSAFTSATTTSSPPRANRSAQARPMPLAPPRHHHAPPGHRVLPHSAFPRTIPIPLRNGPRAIFRRRRERSREGIVAPGTGLFAGAAVVRRRRSSAAETPGPDPDRPSRSRVVRGRRDNHAAARVWTPKRERLRLVESEAAPRRGVGCGGRIRTCDLQVMSLTSYRTAPPRVDGLGPRHRVEVRFACADGGGSWRTWRRPTLPRLEAQYHRR